VAKLSRRAFLFRASAGLAVLVAAPYALYQLKYGKAANVVIAILKRRVGYLRVDPDSFERFASEYLQYKRGHAKQLARLSVVAFPLTYLTLYRLLPMGHPLRRLEDNVVTRYLLSTDFFFHDADESRKINYVSFYDPAATPCRNPFVHLRRLG
jgi:hypothetical protein